jgi:hypothetical protein
MQTLLDGLREFPPNEVREQSATGTRPRLSASASGGKSAHR